LAERVVKCENKVDSVTGLDSVIGYRLSGVYRPTMWHIIIDLVYIIIIMCNYSNVTKFTLVKH